MRHCLLLLASLLLAAPSYAASERSLERLRNADQDLARRAVRESSLDWQWRQHMRAMTAPQGPAARLQAQSRSYWDAWYRRAGYQIHPQGIARPDNGGWGLSRYPGWH